MILSPERAGRLKGPRRGLLLVLVVWCVVMSGGAVEADSEIFVCPDGNGKKHFTNTPESSACVPFRSTKSVSLPSLQNWNGTAQSKWGPAKQGVTYEREIHHFADRYQIDPNLIKAVIRAESAFNSHAVSRRGAQGLMQLMPDTARELKVADPFNPRQNIEGGTRYLRTLLDMFDGNVVLALAAYNAGPTLVKKIRKVPSIQETRVYVKRVLAYYEGYGNGGRFADSFDRSLINLRTLVMVQ